MISAEVRRGLVIVAHPDDESLWCAGAIIRHKIDWTIICCSIPQKDPIRAEKFLDACGVLGAKGKVLPYPETEKLRLDLIDPHGFEIVITHGKAGEYGHPQHKEVHEYVAEKFAKNTLFIGYRKNGCGRFCLDLDDQEWAKKLEAIRCYDHYSPSDNGAQKGQALLDYYGAHFNLKQESYDTA